MKYFLFIFHNRSFQSNSFATYHYLAAHGQTIEHTHNRCTCWNDKATTCHTLRDVESKNNKKQKKKYEFKFTLKMQLHNLTTHRNVERAKRCISHHRTDKWCSTTPWCSARDRTLSSMIYAKQLFFSFFFSLRYFALSFQLTFFVMLFKCFDVRAYTNA